MEFHQQVQNRTAQTVAVLSQFSPSFKIDSKGWTELAALAKGLDATAQTRDDALFTNDQAVRSEDAGFLQIRLFAMKVPPLIEALLGDDHPIVDSLSVVYSEVARTTESAVARAQALRPVWLEANTALAARTPAEGPLLRNGKGIADLDAALAAQPGLEQTMENAAATVRTARRKLRTDAVAVDRLNKRFYKALVAQADGGSPLEDALKQIQTDDANLPDTLGIKKVLQGGGDQLHVLVSYDAGTLEDGATNTLEWQVGGGDTDFVKSVPVDPSGNALGPFTLGQTVKLRTRVTNANGTTTGAIRTLTLQPPIL